MNAESSKVQQPQRISRKRAPLTDIDTNIGNDEPNKGQSKSIRTPMRPAVPQFPTGKILDFAKLNFDEEQRTTMQDEMCRDIKHILQMTIKLEKCIRT